MPSNAANAVIQGPQGKAGPVKPPVVVPGTGNNIIVNPCQRGNPVLECIKNVGKEFGDVVVDYQVGRTTGVLYLSLRYHRLHPEYIHQRIERLGTTYNLRILLILCDVSEHQDPIRELTKICLINNITVMVAWNTDEAGYYLSTYKQFEHKPPDLIKERVDKDYHSMIRTALTSINRVNKTDVEILRTSIGSFADIAKATSDQLLKLPGFGQVKVKRLKDAFEKPFRNNSTSTVPFQPRLSQHDVANNLTTCPEIDPSSSDKVKGKGKAMPDSTTDEYTPPPPSQLRPREPSPVWDIELDLNDTPSPQAALPAPPRSPQLDSSRKRPGSPVWDIELDLNGSDIEEENSRKRHKTGDVDMDEDEDEFRPTELL
ncbi:restriction endonuclease type II-like protein [Irpex rosettiformis]|uniref:Restriction endonuclease type II-like protein n=1 Tax=Irpex rosettiformis TaxID=378272 RepID=A0ACB8UFM0_9APHY|nr:restriction endonuclease type II-like protein [Irpex rosettiformis]